MAFIKHKFGKTYYQKIKCSKKNKGPAIIFLHGGPGGTHQSFLKLSALSQNHDLYLYDQIGGGQSSPISQKDWKIETFVYELNYLIKVWKLEEFILLGGSWGTTLLLEYYLKTKDKRIKKIIFQSPLFSTSDWEMDAKYLIKKLPKPIQKIISYCHEIGATDSKVYKNAIFEYYKRFVLRDEKILKQKPKRPNLHGNKVYEFMWGPSEFKATGTLKNYERKKRLREVAIPVLLICGEHDEATPKTVKKYQKLFPDAKIKVVKNASHSIARENPKEYIKIVKEFIK